MRQPRTFGERLALLNRLNRRQAALPEEEEDDESNDEGVLGVEEDDSASEDSDGNGSISDSDSEDDLGDEDEEDEEDPEESQAPEAPASPDSSMTAISPPAPTGVANNPAQPPSAAVPEASTTEQVVSQITSAAGEASATASEAPLESNSLAQGEQEGTETASGEDASATPEDAKAGGGDSAPALSRGEQVGIVFGALAGVGLLVAVGFALFKWRKRRNASVYDRPPPPGIYGEDDEKREAEVSVMPAEEQNPIGQARGNSMFQVVNSWIQATPNRYSKSANVAAPAPAFVAPERNRDTQYTGFTGSEARWG